MRLSNGEVLLAWPLAQHIVTQGWFYNDGSMHRAIDLRLQAFRPQGRVVQPLLLAFDQLGAVWVDDLAGQFATAQ